jgi:hypothetical protein
MTQLSTFSMLRASLAIGVMVMGTSAPAQAIVYDFAFSSGATPTIAQVTNYHLFVDITEDMTTAANDVQFKFTNEIPVLNSALPPSIAVVYFDTGTYSSLFTGMSVVDLSDLPKETSPGVYFVPRPLKSSPFLPANFTPDYQFGLSGFPYDNPIYGINPGEYAVVSSTLGVGKTFADVIAAMNVGIDANAVTAATGLRIGSFTYYNFGTQRDDAAHLTYSVVSVPEAETWAMMFAGLGLVGFTVSRRKT